MSKIAQFVLASMFVALLGFSSATTVLADTATFNFETLGTTSGGSINTLVTGAGGLTLTLSRPGSSFDIVDFTGAVPPSFGARTLSPFSHQDSNTPFIANFSSVISSLSIEMGDFGGLNADLDTLTMIAYDALDGGGNIIGTTTATCCGGAAPGFVFTTLTVSGAGIRSVRFIGGGGASTANSVYYDNITATFGPAPVPEPATMMLLGTGLIGVAAEFRRRRNSSS